MFDQSQIKQILTIAKEAGDIILQYYEGYKNLSIKQKQDDSPVTAADIAANEFIINELQQQFPNLAIVSEENPEDQNLQAAKNSSYFMIDPLDGTSAFIKKMDDWAVDHQNLLEGGADELLVKFAEFNYSCAAKAAQ